MIGQQFLRIPFYTISPELRALEAMAFCYASRFAGSTITARMLESYMRAWDFDTWAFEPRIEGGRPGWVEVYFNGQYRPKLIIAFQGMGSFSSLAPVRGGASSTAVNGLQGRVYFTFGDYASQAYATLRAKPGILSRLEDRTTPILITGFSMGSAMAEIIAAFIRRDYPRKDVQCVKFAAPTVGTTPWISQRAVTENTHTYHVTNDPIRYCPLFLPDLSNPAEIVPYTFFSPPLNNTVIGIDGLPSNYDSTTEIQRIRDVARITAGPPGRSNNWWYHNWETYRYAFNSLAARYSPWWQCRFQYLETLGENQWGEMFQTGMFDWAPLMVETTIPPVDYNPRFTDQQLQAVERISRYEAAATVGTEPNDAAWDLSKTLDAYILAGNVVGGNEENVMQPLPVELQPLIQQVQSRTRARRSPQIVP